MRMLTFFFWSCSFYISNAHAQEVRLHIYEGMVLGSSVDNYHYKGNYCEGFIKGGRRAGIGVSYLIDKLYEVEVLYYHQHTTVPSTYHIAGGTFSREFDLTLQWFMLGFTSYISKENRRIKSFLGTYMGAGFLALRDSSANFKATRTKFVWGGNVGVDFSLGKIIMLKLKSDALFCIKFATYKSPDSPGNDITAFHTFMQAGLSAGLVIRLNMRHKELPH